MKRFIYLLFIIALTAFLFWSRISKYNEFHDSKIDGKIDTIYRYRDYVMIYVNNVEYRIIPVCLNGDYPLNRIARKGDYAFKNKGSDTLNLLHEGDEGFQYTVKKF